MLAATVPLTESFEVASLAALTDWTFATTSLGTVSLDTTSGARTGSTALRFDVANFAIGSQSEAVILVDLSAFATATDLSFDFWMKRLASSTSSLFFLQVDASGDGTNWSTLSPMLQPESGVWVNYTYDLDQRLSDAGIMLDSDVYLRLRQTGYITSSEVLIDDVRIGQHDVIGPVVTSVAPNATDAPVTSLNLTFSEPLNRFEFDPEDVTVIGPNGSSSLLTGSRPPTNQSQYTYNFDRVQDIPGVYHVSIAASAKDVAGNKLNQDQDERNGETVEDQFIGSFELGPTIPQSVPYQQDFQVSGLANLSGWSFSSQGTGTIGQTSGDRVLRFGQTQINTPSTKDAILALDLSGQNGATDLLLEFDARRLIASAGNQLTVSVSADKVTWFQLGDPILPPDTFTNYVIDLDEGLVAAGIATTESIFMRFRHQATSFTLDLDNVHVLNRDHIGPRLTSIVSNGPVASLFEQFQVSFDEPIDVSTFTFSDVIVTDPSGRKIATRNPVDSGDHQTFTISFLPQTILGSYHIAIGPDIQDPSGNEMNQDLDQSNGELVDDVFEHRFSIGIPVAQTIPYFQDFNAESLADLAGWSFGVIGDQGTIELSTQNQPHSAPRHLEFTWHTSSTTRTSTLLLDLSDQSAATDLTLDFWVNRLSNDTSVNSLKVEVSGDGLSWRTVASSIQSEVGRYLNYFYDLDQVLQNHLIAMDQDVYLRFTHSSTYSLAIDDIRIENRDANGPKVTSLTMPNATSLNQFEIVFDEPINATTFTPGQIQIHGPLGPVDVSISPIDSGDHQTFSVLLDGNQTIPVEYSVAVGPGILDLAGNPMNQDADNINGEPVDMFVGVLQLQTPQIGAGLPYYQSFHDEGDLGPYWFFESEPGGRIRLAEDGQRDHLQMEGTGAGEVANGAIVTLNLAGKSGVRLVFDEHNENDISGSADGIFISDDLGLTWRSILGGASRDIDGWQHREIDLDAASAAVGMSYTERFWVKIGQFGENPWPTQGRRYDHFAVETGVAITVSISDSVATEGVSGPTLKVSRDPASDLSQPLIITLSSSDPSEATMPATATINANESFVDIPVDIVDDNDSDGRQPVLLSARTAQGAPRVAELAVHDNEPGSLLIDANVDSISEAAGVGAAILTLRRTRDFADPLVVNLASRDESEILVQSSVVIPAGSEYVTFTIEPQNDYQIDLTQSVIIDAVANGYVDGSISMDVLDDDTPERRTIGGRVSGSLPADIYEVLTNLSVPQNTTWSIEPGSTLRFDAGTIVTVAGTLLANGLPDEKILFTSLAKTPVADDWAGIDFQMQEQSRSLINHAEISYASFGIRIFNVDDPLLTVSNSELHHNRTGITVLAGSGIFINRTGVLIQDNQIHDNLRDGVEISVNATSGTDSHAAPSIIGNQIYSNGTNGISIIARYKPIGGQTATDGGAYPLVSGNHIHQNHDGIWINANDPNGSTGDAYVGGDYFNNVIESNRHSGLAITQTGEGFLHAKVVNNTFHDNFAHGISHDVNLSFGLLIQNNVVVQNGFGIHANASFAPDASQVRYNDSFGNLAANWLNYPASFGSQTTVNANGTPADIHFNISLDPQFIEGTLMEVPSNSPTKDAGSDLGAPHQDYHGRLRQVPFDLGAYEVQTPPVVAIVMINDGSQQRSMVDRVDITFDQIVHLDGMGGSPLMLVNTTSGQIVDVSTALSQANGKTTVQLAFLPGPSVGPGGTLRDGNYTLTLNASRINNGIHLLDGNHDGNGGDDYSFGAETADSFFRLLGDTDGNRVVDSKDYHRFGLSFLKKNGDANFEASLDSDHDGDVDGQDHGRFKSNLLKRI